mmetsp:Transcript_8093/g.10240  ORF Transcript_8093/g.10240 Transcript_8093/m.10240 type:complete len:81 (-) Transcript_8093:50-292(-)
MKANPKTVLVQKGVDIGVAGSSLETRESNKPEKVEGSKSNNHEEKHSRANVYQSPLCQCNSYKEVSLITLALLKTCNQNL